jgi:two-component system, OmpR family, sensor histidine kinase KdpD
LLDMSRIEEGALKPEKELYSLKTLIYDVLARMEPLLRGRVVRTYMPDDLLLVELDYVQMDEVLTNLLENAVRYTPAGSPIEVSAHIKGKEAILSVADRGPGVPTADLERIFDKFYRVQDQNGRRQGRHPTGTGLGLAVSKGIVEAHGGRIWAELREGGGLVIFVVLPVGEGERSDQ